MYSTPADACLYGYLCRWYNQLQFLFLSNGNCSAIVFIDQSSAPFLTIYLRHPTYLVACRTPWFVQFSMMSATIELIIFVKIDQINQEFFALDAGETLGMVETETASTFSEDTHRARFNCFLTLERTTCIFIDFTFHRRVFLRCCTHLFCVIDRIDLSSLFRDLLSISHRVPLISLLSKCQAHSVSRIISELSLRRRQESFLSILLWSNWS